MVEWGFVVKRIGLILTVFLVIAIIGAVLTPTPSLTFWFITLVEGIIFIILGGSIGTGFGEKLAISTWRSIQGRDDYKAHYKERLRERTLVGFAFALVGFLLIVAGFLVFFLLPF